MTNYYILPATALFLSGSTNVCKMQLNQVLRLSDQSAFVAIRPVTWTMRVSHTIANKRMSYEQF